MTWAGGGALEGKLRTRGTFARHLSAAILLSGGLVAATQAATAASVIEGTWLTEAKSEITISVCPEGYCGYITKVVVPPEILEANKEALATMSVEDYFDGNNKDPALRNRPIMGLQILALRPGKSPSIFDGDIYNPQDGNTYSGYVEVQGSNFIRLNGCVLYNIICRGEDWVRVQ